jgi:hypothetical protein
MRDRAILIAGGTTAAVAVLVVGLLAYAMTRPRHSSNATVYALVGKATLAFPPDYGRGGAEQNGGRLDRLDLAAFFPDFKAAGRLDDVKPTDDLAERAEATVFMTLTPDDGSLDPADRPIRLYARFLDPIGYQHPGGLVRRRFQDGSPYEGEDLYMALPEGRSFWARCPRSPAGAATKPPEPCLWEARLDGLDVAVRFAPALLTQWERLAEGVRGTVKAFLR